MRRKREGIEVGGEPKPSHPPAERVSYFPIYMLAQTTSGFGGVMAAISVIFITLQLTDGSTRWVAAVEAIQYLPMLILARHAGGLVDRYQRKNLLLITQTLQALSTTLLGLTFILGYTAVWPIVLFAGFQGIVQSVDVAARQVFITDLLGIDGFQRGIASYNLVFGLGRMIAPVAAGWLIEVVNAGSVFLVNAVTFGPVIVVLLIIRPPKQQHHSQAKSSNQDPPKDDLERPSRGEFLRTLRLLLPLMVLVVFVGALGYQFATTNALMVQRFFHSSPSSYGLLGGLVAAGGIAGSSWVRHHAKLDTKAVYISAFILGSTEASVIAVSRYWEYIVLMPIAGFAVSTFTACAMSSAQRSVEAGRRGTSMTIYNASYIGFVPFGTLFIGMCASSFGVRSAVAVPGAMVAVCAVIVFLWDRTQKHRLADRTVPADV